MADILVKISYIAFAGAAGCLVLAIILFIKFKIPTVIGDLSGKNAQKAIQQMRESNIKKGNQSFKPGKQNEERGKLTETMAHKKKTEKISRKQEKTAELSRLETGLLKENSVAASGYANETAMLTSEETTLLNHVTEFLNHETEVLTEQDKVALVMIDDIMIVHTKERIS